MKAFWWFRGGPSQNSPRGSVGGSFGGSINGMARPGFNRVRWFELPFDEALLIGWIGQHSSGEAARSSFQSHLASYGPKIFQFHSCDQESGTRQLQAFADDRYLMEVAERAAARTGVLESFQIRGDRLEFTISEAQLERELSHLKSLGVDTIVTLTERHNNSDKLQEKFSTHHFSIPDLEAPQLKQAQELAEIVAKNRDQNRKMSVHCLAGIGRTSTMLIAAHLLLGEKLEALYLEVKEKNPSFILTPNQKAFLKLVAES